MVASGWLSSSQPYCEMIEQAELGSVEIEKVKEKERKAEHKKMAEKKRIISMEAGMLS